MDYLTISLTVVLCVIAFFGGIMLGNSYTTWKFQKEAMEHGLAEWTVDQKTGVATWSWRE